jgi:hypothetical protein
VRAVLVVVLLLLLAVVQAACRLPRLPQDPPPSARPAHGPPVPARFRCSRRPRPRPQDARAAGGLGRRAAAGRRAARPDRGPGPRGHRGVQEGRPGRAGARRGGWAAAVGLLWGCCGGLRGCCRGLRGCCGACLDALPSAAAGEGCGWLADPPLCTAGAAPRVAAAAEGLRGLGAAQHAPTRTRAHTRPPAGDQEVAPDGCPQAVIEFWVGVCRDRAAFLFLRQYFPEHYRWVQGSSTGGCRAVQVAPCCGRAAAGCVGASNAGGCAGAGSEGGAMAPRAAADAPCAGGWRLVGRCRSDATWPSRGLPAAPRPLC